MQQEWLLTRRYYATDKECCEVLKVDLSYGSSAKRSNADFRYCYALILEGDASLVDDSLVESLTKANVLKALIEERKILDMSWSAAADDRLGGAKASAIQSAIARVKGPKSTREHIFSVEEVLHVVEGTVREVR